MKFSFIRPLFFLLIFLMSNLLLANSFQRHLVATHSPAQNYTSLIQNGRTQAAIKSVLATQSLLAQFYNDADSCSSCPNNFYLLEFQRFLYIQAHKELQALTTSIKNYILGNAELKNKHTEDLKILERILVEFEPNFEASPHSARLISNSSYFGVTKVFLAKLLSNLENRSFPNVTDPNLADTKDSYLLHSLTIRNFARLLVLKSSPAEINKTEHFTEIEAAEAFEYWRVLGTQMFQLIEQILANPPPPISSTAEDEIVELQETVKNYTNSLDLLSKQLKTALQTPEDNSRTRDSLKRLLQALKSIADSSHQYSILIDARIILAGNSCEDSLRVRN